LRTGARAHHNSTVTDDGEHPGPTAPVDEESPVTDDDRNRYGLLLDRAAERGLLGPYDYEVRLRDLAAASTIEQMNGIVSELPAFAAVPPTTGSTRARASRTPATGGAADLRSARRRSSPWLLLVIVVVVVAASLVFLAVYAGHLVRTHNSGLAPAAVPARPVSALRP
jgi:hypothetical protein